MDFFNKHISWNSLTVPKSVKGSMSNCSSAFILLKNLHKYNNGTCWLSYWEVRELAGFTKADGSRFLSQKVWAKNFLCRFSDLKSRSIGVVRPGRDSYKDYWWLDLTLRDRIWNAIPEKEVKFDISFSMVIWHNLRQLWFLFIQKLVLLRR